MGIADDLVEVRTSAVQEQINALTDTQRALFWQVIDTKDGRDLRDVLIEQEASAEDRAAVAEVLGGSGAGAEFMV